MMSKHTQTLFYSDQPSTPTYFYKEMTLKNEDWNVMYMPCIFSTILLYLMYKYN